MKSEKQLTEQVKALRDAMNNGVQSLADLKKDSVKGVIGKGAEAADGVVADIIDAVTTIVKGTYVNNEGVPDFTCKYGYNDAQGDTIEFTVKNRSPKASKFKVVKSIKISENLVQDIADVVIDTIILRYTYAEAQKCVDELNNRISEICAENELTIIPVFVVDADNTARLMAVENEKVVYNVTLDEAMEISKLRFMTMGEDEYSVYVRNQVTEEFINEMKAVNTAPQLVKANITVVKNVVGTLRSRVDILLRKSYHKQAKNLGKTGVGYFSETVKVKKEDVDVFAIVEKKEDGDYSVILNPFDKETLAYVDFDVVKAIKKQVKEQA